MYAIAGHHGYYASTYGAPRDGLLPDPQGYKDRPLAWRTRIAAERYLRDELLCEPSDDGTWRPICGAEYRLAHGQYARPWYRIIGYRGRAR